MRVEAIKSRKIIPPKDDLLSAIKESFSGVKIKEKSVIVIASKVVAIWQGRCVKVKDVDNKDDLIAKEADFYIDRKLVPGEYVMLTIKNNLLIPTAGIDESNAKEYYILWPENPYETAKTLHKFFKKTYNLKKIGIILADSHTAPLRWGTVGISLAYYGFNPLTDYRNKKDIFGRVMKITQANRVDALAVAAVCVMGEGKEQTPFAVIEDIDFLNFKEMDLNEDNPLEISKDEDIYAPLLKGIKWKKGQEGKKLL